MANPVKNKKILLVGLGRLGGGTATARFLAENGARLTVTDLNSEKELKNSLAKLKGLKIKFVLGRHREEDFKNNDLVVFNPAVGIFNKWVKVAEKYAKPIENDLTLFLKFLGGKEYAAITGTRGKTTSATWARHFLKPAILGGNIPNAGLFRIIKKITASKKNIPLILELSSFQLEFLRKGLTPPKVAAITNLRNDHLNRYGTMGVYAKMKAKIFLNQTKNDFLILNYDDENKRFFLKEKPRSRIFYVSLRKLPAGKSGLYFDGDKIYFQSESGLGGLTASENELVAACGDLSGHQKYNLLTALLTSYLYPVRSKGALRAPATSDGVYSRACGGAKWRDFSEKIPSLPVIPFRQEIIFRRNGLTVVNDSAATSPDGAIAALERFKGGNLFLISGGTDKRLDFKNMAKKIKESIPAENLFLLSGGATGKIVNELNKLNYFKSEPAVFGDLENIVKAVKRRVRTGIVLFSPAAASFEKFKNEFDRGRKFNKLIKKYYKKYHGI